MKDARIIFYGIMLLVWFVIGVSDLTNRNISHISYFLVWVALLIQLACNMGGL